MYSLVQTIARCTSRAGQWAKQCWEADKRQTFPAGRTITGDSRSIFAWGSEMEFLAGYDYAKDAGTVHVAQPPCGAGKEVLSSGGNNPSGHMWNKILSDKDGHYLELMVGAYSDNQPDYSWINPGEIREFSQIWYPIKGIKGCKNATMDAAVNFEADRRRKVSRRFLRHNPLRRSQSIGKAWRPSIDGKGTSRSTPDRYFLEEVSVPSGVKPSDLYVS